MIQPIERIYYINFEAKKKIARNYQRTIKAPDINKAILKLYKHFEQIEINSISDLTITK
jgi:hypothetical protein